MDDDNAVKQEPIAVKQEPIAAKKEPIPVKQEPIAFIQGPIAVKQEPIAVKQEPISVKQEPIAIKQEPTDNEEKSTPEQNSELKVLYNDHLKEEEMVIGPNMIQSCDNTSKIMEDPSEFNTSKKRKSKKNSESENAAYKSTVLSTNRSKKRKGTTLDEDEVKHFKIPKVLATTMFTVEETRRKNKPSTTRNYMPK